MDAIYSHRQTAWWVPVTCAIFFIVAVLTFFAEGNHPLSLAIALPGLVIYWLFDGLKVEVNATHIILKFGHGPIKKSIVRETVAGANAVRNNPLYGWGIRLTPHGMLWNIHGLSAVELTYLNGKRFRIGSDDTEQLLTAILKQP
ncbi:MAG: hypothetical protein H8E25_13170 [Planctomycetes bacterium]|nr:hypothetical protein [Planctomycetota bacterium]